MKIHGGRLYVAGQDHVVRSYALKDNGDIDTESCRIYRWPSWQQERGNILAMDISRDGTKLAVGGIGLRDGLICELSLASGEVLRSDAQLDTSSVSSISYALDNSLWVGSSYGQILYWPENSAGKIVVPQSDRESRAPMKGLGIHANECLSIDSQGNIQKAGQDFSKVLSSICTPGEFVASVENGMEGEIYCVVRNLQEMSNRVIKIGIEGERIAEMWNGALNDVILEQIAMSDRGECYAIGRKHTPEYSTDSLLVIDIANGTKVEAGRIDRLDKVLSAVVLAQDRILISLQSQGLVTLHLNASTNVFDQKGVESESGGIQNLNFLGSDSFSWQIGNHKKTFDLRLRQLAPEISDFISDRSNEEEWCTPVFDTSVPSRMSIELQGARKVPVELMVQTDQWATSSLAINYGGQQLLLVGHRFGTSVFRLEQGSRLALLRKLIGHNDSVTDISFDEQAGIVLTGGLDGAICCFSLKPWRFHNEFGATFEDDNGKLTVVEIDPGSPIWETGLNEGETIDNLYYMDKKVEVSKAVELLLNPKIGELWQFQTKRLEKGVGTRCLQRPIWKFYERDGEWVWWRWRDFYYDCSTNGEKLVIWQLNQGLDRSPIVMDGTEARARFYRPMKLQELVSKASISPERIFEPELVPPRVAMSIEEHEDHYLISSVLQPDSNAFLVGEPRELSVWINDYQVASWQHPQIGRPETCRLEKRFLRSGKNRLISRAFNQIGIRGDSKELILEASVRARRPTLRSIAIGIRDYSDARQLRYTVRDAQELTRLFERQSDSFNVDCRILLDNQATRENVFKEISAMASVCDPDDWLIISFAGHGYSWERRSESGLPPSFMLLTSQTSLASESAASRTAIPIGSLHEGVQFESLFKVLSGVPCRKLVLLDACHSGGALEIVKALTPDLVVGPTVLTASQRLQRAQEVPTKLHGVFTAAVLEAISNCFDDADRSGDGKISPRELYDYTHIRVPKIFIDAKIHIHPEDIELGQTPEFWSPSEDQDLPIFAPVRD